MITIDGSKGEGGGQILRNAIAFSIITNTPVTIHHIRAKRSKPGLRPQHSTAIKLLAQISQANTSGVAIGSSTVSFHPQMVTGGRYEISTGTAGSITLIFQACLLCGLVTESPIVLTVTGGTDVAWSPSWDYFTQVFLPTLHRMGIECHTTLHKRGYYPKGGGQATLIINPIKTIQPLVFGSEDQTPEVYGSIHTALLPDHIPKRMKHTAVQLLLKQNLRASIDTTTSTAQSPGIGITLWMRSKKRILGSTVLGTQGIPAEKVAEQATEQLLSEYRSDAYLDSHLFDQVLPHLAFAAGSTRCRVRKINSHAETTVWLLSQFFRHEMIKKSITDSAVDVTLNVINLNQ